MPLPLEPTIEDIALEFNLAGGERLSKDDAVAFMELIRRKLKLKRMLAAANRIEHAGTLKAVLTEIIKDLYE